jgi:hypothetical protein
MTHAETYLEKSPDAGRKARASEYLVAALCILATRGRVNVSTSLVDDEGVDLVFHLRNSPATLAVQVKPRMTDGAIVARGRFQAQVRSATFRPRGDLDMLYVLVDNSCGAIKIAWLVPSPAFDRLHGTPTTRANFRFSAAISGGSGDKWSPYRLPPAELPMRIIERLEALESGG